MSPKDFFCKPQILGRVNRDWKVADGGLGARAGCVQMPTGHVDRHRQKASLLYYSNGTEGSELNLSLRKVDDFMAFQIYKATGGF